MTIVIKTVLPGLVNMCYFSFKFQESTINWDNVIEEVILIFLDFLTVGWKMSYGGVDKIKKREVSVHYCQEGR